MTSTFEVLAEPTRRRILVLLREQPRLVGDLVSLLGITQPNVSKHLRVLREAGLVNVRQDETEGRRHWYELRAEPLAEVDAWLQPFRHHMEASYDRLESVLNELEQEENAHDQQNDTAR
jgi:DNA-binding transcriptional ArsR family regulator